MPMSKLLNRHEKGCGVALGMVRICNVVFEHEQYLSITVERSAQFATLFASGIVVNAGFCAVRFACLLRNAGHPPSVQPFFGRRQVLRLEALGTGLRLLAAGR